MGSLIVLADDQGAGLFAESGRGLPEQGLLTRLVMSLGAGVYEESVFRLGLLGGSIAAFEKLLGMSRWAAVLGAFVFSSAVFSFVHYLPPTGDAFTFGSFTFRCWPGSYSVCCSSCAASPSQSTRTPSTTSSFWSSLT
jgi:membrane protease YdiL (CAAX protease family)